MLDARSNTPNLMSMGFKKVRFNLPFLRPFFILFTAIIFLFNSVGGDLMLSESWAARISSGLPSVGSEDAGSPTPLKNLSADTFTMPRELGYIQEAVKVPDSARTVIHIQDAHCNYAAQKRISEILSYLTAEYGIYAVNCEGGKDNYDLTVFTAIDENDIREKVSDFFVKEGVVNAAEFFAANNPDKAKLWGVEDADLYIKNLKIYKESLVHKDEVDRYIRSIMHILGKLKKHIYSPELLDFDNQYMKYKENQVSFKEYIAYLITAAQKNMINIKSFPDIYLLGQTLEEEDKINFKRANNEKDEVVDKLKKVLSKNELEELVMMVGHMKIERISQADFYAYLVKKARSVKLNMKDYPELEKYIVYVSIYSAIDRTKITRQIDSLEDKIKESLYENDAQRELGILSKNLVLEKNMFNISLTRDDYTYYKKYSALFSVSNFTHFIDKWAPLYKIQAPLDSNIASLDVYRERMEAFYECSLERDKAFVKNIKFTDHSRPSSIIITGGFHTENLRELFKNEKVSYISIMPKFTSPPGYESPYLKRLAGQRTALENVIDTAIPAVLNLAVVNILSTELAIEVEGKANIEKFRLAVLIMAAVERGKKFIFKVDREAYPKEGRPQEDKVIVFSGGEGGNISSAAISPNEPDFTGLANTADAVLTAIGTNAFAFNLISPRPQAQIVETPPQPSVTTSVSPEATKEGVPVIKPFAVIIEGTPQLLPADRQPPEAAAIAATQAELMYKAAVEPAIGTASIIRRNIATRIISLVASDGDKVLVGSLGQSARNLIGPDIHLSSYVDNADKGVWMPELKKLLKIELKNFVENDLIKRAPLMEIRIKEGENAREIVEQMIEDILIELGYQEKIKDIKNRIRLVQVQIESGKYTNPAVEFFADIGMLECDRYINGDYGDENRVPPQDLQHHFLALLKLSIKNGADFEDKNINEILNMIFAGHLLEIKPADFKSFDEWNRANRQLLQSV